MPDIYLLSDELMFTSRVSGTARDLGYSISVARTSQALIDGMRKEPPRCVMIDLANPNLELANIIEVLRTLPRRPIIISYGSHVDASALASARAAGCDLALPRSKFAADLSNALGGWLNHSAELPS